jgi:pyruvate,water dikinase
MAQNQDHAAAPIAASPEWVDPIAGAPATVSFWSTVNLGEAVPGVPTPLSWSWYEQSQELATRRAYHAMGVYPSSYVRYPPHVDDRILSVFSGRAAINVDRLRDAADRLPGTSGDALEEQLYGRLRPGVSGHNTIRRYPVIAAKLPWAARSARARLTSMRSETEGWWRRATTTEARTPEESRQLISEAYTRFCTSTSAHILASFFSQSMYAQLATLSASVGLPGLEMELTGGYGSIEEAAMLAELWDTARRGAELDGFLSRYGFHGQQSGEMSVRVWREDRAALLRVASSFRDMEEAASPRAAADRQRRTREDAERRLIAALPGKKRPTARLVIRLASRYLPLREVGRSTFLQAIDAARAASRELGADLTARGRLDDPEDIFYLTLDELISDRSPDREQIRFRRACRDRYLGLRLPESWIGLPEPEKPDGDHDGEATDHLAGVGVSPGVVEGRARIVVDTSISELEPGEILVCETTDPSWTTLFHVAAAAVIDLGSALGHGSIIAREIGMPCVVCTRDGTRRVRTGDLLQVDGTTGIVSIVERTAS